MSEHNDSADIERERYNFPARTVVVALLVDFQKRLLLVRTHRLPRRWQPVGGGVDPEDEGLQNAICREVLEECGVEIPPQNFNHIFQAPYDFGTGNVHFYKAHLPSHNALVMDTTELLEWGWFTLQEALSLPMYPATEACLRLVCLQPELLSE